MPITTIVIAAAIASLAINGLLFIRTLHHRVSQLNSRPREESTTPLIVRLIKKVLGAFLMMFMSPITGLCIMSATVRHHTVGGFLKNFLEDRQVSLEDERELVKWFNETHPLPEVN